MNRSIFLSFLIFPFCLQSQHFTRASVFDYAVGDTIVTSSWQYLSGSGLNGPPTYHYRIFTGKNYSANNDTIFYQFDETSVTPPANMNGQATITNTVSSFFVTDLSDTVIHKLYTTAPCQTLAGLGSLGFCNFHTYIKNSEATAACPSTISHTVIEGIGTFVEETYNNSNPPGMSFRSRFEYASKVGKGCGVVGSIPTGLQEYVKSEWPLIPNPNSGEFYVALPTDCVLKVCSPGGQLLETFHFRKGIQRICLSEPDGIYFLQWILSEGMNVQKLIINR